MFMDSPLVRDCATSAFEDQIQTGRSTRVELYHEHGRGCWLWLLPWRLRIIRRLPYNSWTLQDVNRVRGRHPWLYKRNRDARQAQLAVRHEVAQANVREDRRQYFRMVTAVCVSGSWIPALVKH